jgi:predicted GTPase
MAVAERRRVVICGAAGRDFHNFNVVFRDDSLNEVVAFTAAQIPGIEGRVYPPELAGPHYPEGIPIVSEDLLWGMIREQAIDAVVFAYSDVSHAQVMHVASRVISAGADFEILGPNATSVTSARPVIAISAVRTGCGKSQVARYLSQQLRERGVRVAVIRHPMPYGVLAAQSVQRFATLADIEQADCTLEEREEYEPHVAAGNVIFAGVDYAAIVATAEREADVLIWDGGNNDFPFLVPGLHLVVVDALRPDQLTSHHPGEAVLRMADAVIANKVDAATVGQVTELMDGLRRIVPDVPIVQADSPVRLDASIEPGTRVLIVEDGPTITHGGMAFGSGYTAVSGLDVEIIDPRCSASPAIQAVYAAFPHIGRVLPAMGYSAEQRDALRETIEASVAEVVVAGTPIDFARDVPVRQPVVRARYEYRDHGAPTLMGMIDDFLARAL